MKYFFYIELIGCVYYELNIVLKHNSWSESGLLSLGFFDFSMIIY